MSSSVSSVLFLTTADSRIDGSTVTATSYHSVILEVSLQRHKTRGHSEQPLELVFLRLDQCGGALAESDDARVPGEEDERPDEREHGTAIKMGQKEPGL